MSLLLLAQSAATSPSGSGGWSFDSFPTQDQLVDSLLDLAHHQYGPALAVLMLGCGLVYTLEGWKIFKVLVVVNVAVFGALVGNWLGAMAGGEKTWVYTTIAGALLLGGLAWPLMKYAVSLLGGLFGSVVGYALWAYVTSTILDRPDLMQYAWIGGVVGLITLGLLAFVILKFVVRFITSLQGAVMIVGGALAMLLKYLGEDLERPLRENSHLVLVLVGVPTVIGFVFQSCWFKPPKKTGGGSGGGGGGGGGKS
jgi:hypothetical protein